MRIALNKINKKLKDSQPCEIIQWAVDTFPEGLVMTSSFGIHASFLLHTVSKCSPNIPIIFIDTGYLFPETYRFVEEVRKKFNLNLKIYSSQITSSRQEALYGKLWEIDVEKYFEINKVEPLKRALKDLNAVAWISGIRSHQTKHRASQRIVEVQDGIYKIHPILQWTEEKIERYISQNNLPFHPLYDKGYKSVGDKHATGKTREGRLLCSDGECGIHLSKLK